MIEAYFILVSKRMLLDVVNSILLLTLLFNIPRLLLHKNFPNYVPSFVFLFHALCCPKHSICNCFWKSNLFYSE